MYFVKLMSILITVVWMKICRKDTYEEVLRELGLDKDFLVA